MNRDNRGAGAEVGVSDQRVQLSASFDEPRPDLVQAPGQLVGKYISIVAQGKLLDVEGYWLSALVAGSHSITGVRLHAQAH